MNYEPMMIRNPFIDVMNNDEWQKVADSFSISMLGGQHLDQH